MRWPAFVRNNQWVSRYAKGITILGILMIVGGGIRVGMVIHLFGSSVPEDPRHWYAVWDALFGCVNFCVFGLLTIALSQLLVYVIGPGLKPGRILRKASVVLLFMAGLSIVSRVGLVVIISTTMLDLYGEAKWIWPIGWNLAYGIGGALLYTTLAFTLRRVLPVIEESKGVV